MPLFYIAILPVVTWVHVTLVFNGKTSAPISVTEEGIDICVNDEHPLKA